MNITYIERQELNALSKEAFGASSRWQKMVNKGVQRPYERDREVLVPTPKGIQVKVVIDRKMVLERYTVEDVRKLMLDRIEVKKAQNTEAITAE